MAWWHGNTGPNSRYQPNVLRAHIHMHTYREWCRSSASMHTCRKQRTSLLFFVVAVVAAAALCIALLSFQPQHNSTVTTFFFYEQPNARLRAKCCSNLSTFLSSKPNTRRCSSRILRVSLKNVYWNVCAFARVRLIAHEMELDGRRFISNLMVDDKFRFLTWMPYIDCAVIVE